MKNYANILLNILFLFDGKVKRMLLLWIQGSIFHIVKCFSTVLRLKIINIIKISELYSIRYETYVE